MDPLVLYTVVSSHPSIAVDLMLRHKGLPYRTVELPAGLSHGLLRLRGFDAGTVPALRIGRRRVQNSLVISRALEELAPDPPLFPAEQRHEIEEAERWGEQFQNLVRRIELWALLRDRAGLAAQARAARIPLPAPLLLPPAQATVRYLARVHGATDAAVKADLDALPTMLAQIDDWIAGGLLDGLNAATFQIMPSVRLLMTIADLSPLFENSPAAELAKNLVPDYAAQVSRGVLPAPRSWERVR